MELSRFQGEVGITSLDKGHGTGGEYSGERDKENADLSDGQHSSGRLKVV